MKIEDKLENVIAKLKAQQKELKRVEPVVKNDYYLSRKKHLEELLDYYQNKLDEINELSKEIG